LDDAVFSTYGIAVRQERVKIVSVFAGLPDEDARCGSYDRLTRSTNPRARYAIRRVEDAEVVGSMGWECVQMDCLDKPYRLGRVPSIDVACEIRRELVGFEAVFVPAAIGLHDDHVAARDAALLAASGGACEMYLYADFPYAAYYGWPPSLASAPVDPHLDIDAYWEEALSSVRATGALEGPLVLSLDAHAQGDKIRAMRGYASQFPAIEGGPSAWLTHKDRIGIEVYWRLTT